MKPDFECLVSKIFFNKGIENRISAINKIISGLDILMVHLIPGGEKCRMIQMHQFGDSVNGFLPAFYKNDYDSLVFQ